ncbi:hypothetical protein DVH24_014860 [Malus domestica]|uniref:Uncharacterized protein n=1 Tax=Malus domestica TaxID=3750 RepID=A0A498K1Q1_MALDO|nr:hypothetical protein DVH24_014860 [Malus domestica]
MVIDQWLPGAVEQVGTAMRAELGLACGRLCAARRIGPLVARVGPDSAALHCGLQIRPCAKWMRLGPVLLG